MRINRESYIGGGRVVYIDTKNELIDKKIADSIAFVETDDTSRSLCNL